MLGWIGARWSCTSTHNTLLLERKFPGLIGTGWVITSPSTPVYNCIAWAASETHRFWWPNPQAYWPPSVPREETIEAFVSAFATLGYLPCDSDQSEAGIEKVALFAAGDTPQHAARQLETGTWTSKLGKNMDIEHPLKAVEGNEYGSIVEILQRPR